MKTVDHQIADLLRPRKKAARLHHELLIVRGKITRRQQEVALLQGLDHLEGGRIVGPEPQGIDRDPYLPALAADHVELPDVRILLQFIAHIKGNPAEFVSVVTGAPEGKGEDGHIVDRSRFYERLGNARRDLVVVGHELVVEVDDALLHVLADIEPHDGDAHAGSRHGVDVFHALDLPEELRHGFRDPLIDLLGGGAGVGDKDIDHGNDDLRLFLPGGDDDGKDAEHDRGDDDERRQLRLDEGLGDLTRRFPASLLHQAAVDRRAQALPRRYVHRA